MLNNLIPYILSLPIVLLALSVHEACHGLAAYKLGDPTARNLGRLTINPAKHIDPLGFLCMVVFHFGWAKPVPINSRYFKKPRRDMALTAAAGPVSNILLSVLFAGLLRLQLWLVSGSLRADINAAYTIILKGVGEVSPTFKIMAVLAYMLYIGVVLNISLAVFNLIPTPPFDGSRILYTFLPVNLYFKVMRYERIIMVVILVLLWTTPLLSGLVSGATSGLASLIMRIFGIAGKGLAKSDLDVLLVYFTKALIS